MSMELFWLSVIQGFLAIGFGVVLLLWVGTLNPVPKRKDPLWFRWGCTLLSLVGMLFFGYQAIATAFSGW